jgi:superoxide dismutase, Cu-Zn family
MKTMKWMTSLLLAGTLASGCGPERDPAVESEMGESPGEGIGADATEAQNATVARPAADHTEVQMVTVDGEVIGSAVVEDEGDGVNILVNFAGLEPGTYAFHIHENAACDPPDFESAGGHFDRNDRAHGFQDPEGPHDGDLPNLVVEEDGTARVEIFNARVTLSDLRSGGGTSLVLHAEADDYITDPAGDAGNRIACGIIPAE